MSSPIKMTVGFLLLIIAALTHYNIGTPGVENVRMPVTIFLVVLGVPFLYSGLAFQTDEYLKQVTVKKATYGNFFTGLTLVIIGIVTLYLFENVFVIRFPIVNVIAMFVVLFGVIRMFTMYENVCRQCESSSVRDGKLANDIHFAHMLEHKFTLKKFDVIEFTYCPQCDDYMIVKVGKQKELLEGGNTRDIYTELVA